MKLDWLILLVALSAASPCLATEVGNHADCDEVYGDGYEHAVLDLLDPNVPADRRARAFEGYQRVSAIAHCTDYTYTLGQLYRLGPDLPGNLATRDTARAQELLLASAEAGRMDAYANLAEMALRDGEAREAMKWTQVYLYFVKNVEKSFMDRESVQFYSAAYNGDLLSRAERAWRRVQPKLDRKLIVEDLSGYVSLYKKQVAERISEEKAEAFKALAEGSDDGLRVKSVGACTPGVAKGISAAVAVYILEILPSGKIGRVLPESFSPDPVVLSVLAPCALVYDFEPFEGERPKTVRVPVMFGYGNGRYAPSFKL